MRGGNGSLPLSRSKPLDAGEFSYLPIPPLALALAFVRLRGAQRHTGRGCALTPPHHLCINLHVFGGLISGLGIHLHMAGVRGSSAGGRKESCDLGWVWVCWVLYVCVCVFGGGGYMRCCRV